jgi:hypothetical protein
MKLLTVLIVTAMALDAQPKQNPYQGLRTQILEGSRASFGLPAVASRTTPWAVLMDWGTGGAVATVVAISDGTASVYLSNGGGYIGGGESQEAMRKAARDAVALAASSQGAMRPTTSYPLPQQGEVIFYAITDSGVFTARATQAEMGSGTHALAKLGNAMQQIITLYRTASAK